MKNGKIINSGTRPALAMLLCSCIAFSAAASYMPPLQDPPAVAAAVPSRQATALSSKTSVQEPQTESTTAPASTEKAYEPAPYILNLAYQYPEGSEESYAELLMKELIQKDSQWYAEIYDMANTAPKRMTARLGKPAASVLGKYNPTSKNHDENDPSTWWVEHFKNVRVSFYNGDGDVTSAVSNAQDILSMASVYAYYNGITDIGQIQSYINQLWSLSHSYGVSMGDVYFCEGCVNPDEGKEESDSELENEDTFQEGRIIDTEINTASASPSGGETQESSGAGSSDETSNDLTATSEGEIALASGETDGSPSQETMQTAQTPGDSDASESPSGAGSPSGAESSSGAETLSGAETPSGAETSSETGISSETGAGSAGNTDPQGNSSQEGGTGESVPEVTLIEDEGRTAAIITEAETSPEETTEFIWDPETEAPPLIIRLDDETKENENKPESSQSTSAGSGEESSDSSNVSDTAEAVSMEETSVTATPSEASETRESESAGNAASNSGKGSNSGTKKSGGPGAEKICPGHVDLKITAKIRSLSEKANLYDLDQKGNAVEEGSEWQGWTSRTKAFVRHINRQSWAEEYDLNVTLPGSRAPLSTTEIDSYMNQIPADTTEDRKNIIRFALQSVGKVPYYWGGKPDSRNYSGNSFGSVTIPDHKGRILRGLDCSGWINWVYWSVTGNRLPYEGTDGLKTTGSQIARQDLKPGDIIVITGSTPHVIMFMNWTADGQIQCVHETGSANNVTVGVMTANWPYYRNLLD